MVWEQISNKRFSTGICCIGSQATPQRVVRLDLLGPTSYSQFSPGALYAPWKKRNFRSERFWEPHMW